MHWVSFVELFIFAYDRQKPRRCRSLFFFLLLLSFKTSSSHKRPTCQYVQRDIHVAYIVSRSRVSIVGTVCSSFSFYIFYTLFGKRQDNTGIGWIDWNKRDNESKRVNSTPSFQIFTRVASLRCPCHPPPTHLFFHGRTSHCHTRFNVIDSL